MNNEFARGIARAGLLVLAAYTLVAGNWAFIPVAGVLALTFWHPGKRS